MTRRAIVLLLDSFGIGASADANLYGDEGSNTFAHIAQWCVERRQKPLNIPNLCRLGLNHALKLSVGEYASGLPVLDQVAGKYGYAVEKSKGKDTPSGHWEIAGVPVMFDWGYFQHDYPSFPKSLVDALIEKGNIPGVLGNYHASGTKIIEDLGPEHIKSGKPIIYTSADSVFQIAAHEDYFGLERLCHLCEVARKLVDPYNIGRVIARPFIGEAGSFERTGNRRDYSMPPPDKTLFDYTIEDGGEVIAIGKTADIFAHQGISQNIKATGLHDLFDKTLIALKSAKDKSLIFTNFVDFDSHYGHRRDIPGYAEALELVDARLPELENMLQEGDLVIITADHGCDPTWPGSDHTREHIPVIAYGPGVQSGEIGRRETFADIGQTIAKHLFVRSLKNGVSFLS